MKEKKKNPLLPRIFTKLQRALSSFLSAIALAVTGSVHIPEIAIGPIVGALITSTTTLILGALTISNIFSEQFLYRPLQIQDNNAQYNLELESYRHNILSNYLNQITQLTLNYSSWQLQQNLNLLRADTQVTLAELNGARKRYVIIFLKDTHLISFNQSQVSNNLLKNANLEEAKLENLDLSYSNFFQADLMKANLNKTNLKKSNFQGANLTEATLINANLAGAIFKETDLTKTNLTNACYDLFTKFPLDFDPEKAKMREIKPFTECEIIPVSKDVKKTALS